MRFGHIPRSLLKSLGPPQVEKLREIGHVRSYRKNATIYSTGQPTDSLALVMRGRVRLRDIDRAGRPVTVSFAAAGEAFGIGALAETPRRGLFATAAEGSEVLFVDAGRLREALTTDPGLARALLRHLAALNAHVEDRIKMLAFLDVPGRLAATLLWLAERYGVSEEGPVSEDDVEIPYWFTHQELADLIGSTRETVTTVLADFKRAGLIAVHGHHFVVTNRYALAERTGQRNFGDPH